MKTIINNISWAEYSVTVLLLLVIYYTYILLRFFPHLHKNASMLDKERKYFKTAAEDPLSS